MPSATPLPSNEPPLDPSHQHSNTNATHPDVPPFPPLSTFSILPDLFLLVSRLTPLQDTQPQSQPTSQPTDPSTTTAPLATTPSAHTTNPLLQPPLPPKSLPLEVYPVKTKITKARAAVLALPDVDRGLEEQEKEIRMLEGRVEGLRGRLRELGGIAGRGRRGSGMEGVEKV